ncbi:MAG: ABC transporter permease [Burkholderiaceae bacterium]
MATSSQSTRSPYVTRDPAHGRLQLRGHWRIGALGALSDALEQVLAPKSHPPLQVDGAAIESLDTAAALLLCQKLDLAKTPDSGVQVTGLSARHERVLNGVLTHLRQHPEQLPSGSALPAGAQNQSGLVARIGMQAVSLVDLMRTHAAYFGLTLATLGTVIRRPRSLRVKELTAQLAQTGLLALPVIALVMFLIGAVMAYLLGLQAEQYGANIYVVDGVALGTVREFAPLLVATVVAGRSGASFTAQLGTMKLTEEIDAIRTLGLAAEQVLLLPRVLALVITLPLLVFVGSVLALAGAALVCDLMLGITPDTFLERLRSEVALRHYFIGLLKAPVFAVVIAVIGCSMGLSVARDTRSIGMNTTATVVQCIVAVVLLNAVFAIVFQQLGW